MLLFRISLLIRACQSVINTNFKYSPVITKTTAYYPSTFADNTLLSTDIAHDQAEPYFLAAANIQNAGNAVGIHRVIDLGGTTLNERSNDCDFAVFVRYIGPHQYILACKNSNVNQFQIQKSGAATSIVKTHFLSTSHNLLLSRTSFKELGKTYIFATSQGAPTVMFHKFDSAAFGFVESVSCNVGVSLGGKNVIQMLQFGPDSFVAIGDFQFVVESSTVSLTSSRKVDTDCVYDYVLAAGGYLYSSCYVSALSSYRIRRVSIAGAVAADQIVGVTVANKVHNMRSVPGLPYFVCSDQTTVRYFTLDLAPLDVTNGMARAYFDSYVESIQISQSKYITAFARATNPITLIPSIMDFSFCGEVVVGVDTECSKCMAGYYLSFAKTCIKIPNRYGLAVGTNNIHPCADGCETCSNDYLVCSKCQKLYYFLGADCISVDAIPAGMGVEVSSATIVPCEVQNCRNCSNDKAVCAECAAGFFKNMTDQKCSSNDVDGYGLKIFEGTAVIDRCQVDRCRKCSNDVESCLDCRVGFFLLSNQDQICVSNTVEGFGLNSNGTLSRCAADGCSKCFQSVDLCEVCLPGFQLIEVNSTCRLYKMRSLLSSKYDRVLNEVTLEYDGVVKLLQNVVFLRILKLSQVLSESYQKAGISTNSKTSVTISLNLTVACDDCTLQVFNLSKILLGPQGEFIEDLATLSSIQMVVKNEPEYIFKSESVEMPIKSTSASIQGINFLMFMSGQSRVQLIKIIDEFETFLYLNGKRAAQTDDFVSLFSYEIWKVIPNLFKVKERAPACTFDNKNLSKYHPTCAFLNNNGSKFMGFCFIAGLCLISEMIVRMSKIQSRSVFKKKRKSYLLTIHKFLNFGLVIQTLDAMQVDNMIYAFADLSGTSTSISSSVVSLLLVFGYLALIVAVLRKIFKLRQNSTEPISLKREVDLSQFGYLSYLYRGYRQLQPTSACFYLPLLNLIRCAVNQFLVVFVVSSSNAQLWTLILIEGCQAISVAVYRPYACFATNLEETVTRITMWLVYATHLIYQYTDFKSAEVERLFSWLQISLFLVVILVSFVPQVLFLIKAKLSLVMRKKKEAKQQVQVVSCATNKKVKLESSRPPGLGLITLKKSEAKHNISGFEKDSSEGSKGPVGIKDGGIRIRVPKPAIETRFSSSNNLMPLSKDLSTERNDLLLPPPQNNSMPEDSKVSSEAGRPSLARISGLCINRDDPLTTNRGIFKRPVSASIRK